MVKSMDCNPTPSLSYLSCALTWIVVLTIATSVNAQDAKESMSGPSAEQPFLSLINDLDINLEVDLDFGVAPCQLNAPAELASLCEGPACKQACCETLSKSRARLMAKLENPSSASSSPEVETSECPACTSKLRLVTFQTPNDAELKTCNGNEACGNEAACNEKTCDCDEQQEFRKQLAKNLRTTLSGSQDCPEAQTRAIEAAFDLIESRVMANQQAASATCEIEATKNDLLCPVLVDQSATTNAISKFGNLVSATNVPASEVNLLAPVYETQSRNTRRIENLTSENSALRDSVSRLEVQVARLALQQRAKISDAEARQMMNATKAGELLENEVEKMHAELKKLEKKIQSQFPTVKGSPVLPANFLEPAYAPTSRPLTPMRKLRR